MDYENLDKATQKKLDNIYNKAIEKMQGVDSKKDSATLYRAMCKIAELVGHDSRYEVTLSPLGDGVEPRAYHVLYEACPLGYYWGSSLSWELRTKNYCLEPYYGCDVAFTKV